MDYKNTVLKITNAQTLAEVKEIVSSVMQDQSLTAAQRYALVALYKARKKEIVSEYLKKAYESDQKKLFWNLYKLLRHNDVSVKKAAIQIVYEIQNSLAPEEKEVLFNIYQAKEGKNEDKDIDPNLEAF
jgi:hypothetical protein